MTQGNISMEQSLEQSFRIKDPKDMEDGRLSYKIPYEYGPYFEKIFDTIDNDMPRFGISSYSIRVSTLEEVFIEIGRREKDLEDKKNADDMREAEILTGPPPISGGSYCGRLRSLIVSMFQVSLFGGTSVAIVFVAICLMTFCCVLSVIPCKLNQPAVTFSPISHIYDQELSL